MSLKKKHIIITKLFEFGGSNSHLKTLLKYFGEENVILVLEDNDQLLFLKTIVSSNNVPVKIKPNLYPYAHLRYRLTTNIKELFLIVRSVLMIFFLSLRYNFADVTVCAVDPEKHLYLLWVPWCKVNYILHTAPNKCYTSFSSYTCNRRLGKQKTITTVSNANKDLISKNWEIGEGKLDFIHVIYNCVIESPIAREKNNRRKNDKLQIITLGHVIGYKNPVIWLEVAKTLTVARPEVYFTWFGNGPLLNEFRELTEGNQSIIFYGAVADPDSRLINADIYYQPSTYETHGIAVVEAMYHRLPCVVSNVGGLIESVENNCSGILVPPDAVNEHVDALLLLIDNAELRENYGHKGYENYLAKFSYSTYKIRMDQIYHD